MMAHQYRADMFTEIASEMESDNDDEEEEYDEKGRKLRKKQE
eukprot:CAMPEP_0170544706 /NCGR_PEP_ID=MMETSP0211-20121228/3363_1 /TAXON_ID=311385 /ORGANISM="Pseudokeronopsis sp., Strain OXSARD2" /LENGTH=41 /DNA_ID= /DNA_START= /DNA_END= /DNA_ORIENTATION=